MNVEYTRECQINDMKFNFFSIRIRKLQKEGHGEIGKSGKFSGIISLHPGRI